MKYALVLVTLFCITAALSIGAPGVSASSAAQGTQNGQCSELQAVFLIDQSGSMSDTSSPSDPQGLRYFGPQRAVEILSALRYQSYRDSTMKVSVVNFGTQPATALPWTELNATNQVEHQKIQQTLAPSFASANLGFTNHRAAFENAASLFAVLDDRRKPPDPAHPCPDRAVILLTDGAPQLSDNDASDFYVNHLTDLAGYVRRYMPSPQYHIYVIGIDAGNNYWDKVRPYWEAVTSDPSRVVRVNTPAEMGAQVLSIVEELTRSLALGTSGGVPTTACVSNGKLVVPPFVQEIRLTLIKPDPGLNLQVEDTPGHLLNPSRTDVKVSVEGLKDPIETLIVQRPQPGIWSVLTHLPPPPTPNACQIRVLSFSAAAQATMPSPKETVQFKRMPLSFQIADGSGAALPDYGSQYPLNVEARLVNATGTQNQPIQLNTGANYTYDGAIIPFDSGPHRVEVRATSRDPNGSPVVMLDFKPVANLDVAPVTLSLNGLATPRLPQYGTTPISLTLTTGQGPVALDVPVTVTVNLIAGAGAPVTLAPTDAGGGIYTLDLKPDQAGAYRLEYRGVVSTPTGERELGAGSLNFDVIPTTRIDARIISPTDNNFVATDWLLRPTGLVMEVQMVDETGKDVSPGAVNAADQQRVLKANVLDAQQNVILKDAVLDGLGKPGLFRLNAKSLGPGKYTVVLEPTAPLGEGYVWTVPRWSREVSGQINPLFFGVLFLTLVVVGGGILATIRERYARRFPLSGYINVYIELPTIDGETYRKTVYRRQLPQRNRIVLTSSRGLAGWIERTIGVTLGGGQSIPFKRIVASCQTEAQSNAKLAHMQITLRNGQSLSTVLGPDTPPIGLPMGYALEKGPRTDVLSGMGSPDSVSDSFNTPTRR
ncbi:MAG: vWA domain-containing protein [Chloroflexales bacterium]